LISIEDQVTIPKVLRIIRQCGFIPGKQNGENIDVKTIMSENLFEIFIFKLVEKKVLGLFPVKELKDVAYLYIPEWTLHAPHINPETINLLRQIANSCNRHIQLVNG
jgi:hypothetical protein